MVRVGATARRGRQSRSLIGKPPRLAAKPPRLSVYVVSVSRLAIGRPAVSNWKRRETAASRA